MEAVAGESTIGTAKRRPPAQASTEQLPTPASALIASDGGPLPLDIDDVDMQILGELAPRRRATTHDFLAELLVLDRKTVCRRIAHLRRLGLTVKGQRGEVITPEAIAWMRLLDQ